MAIRRIWKASVKVVPFVLGELGTVGNARSDLEMLGIKHGTEIMQTAALLWSAHITFKDVESLTEGDLVRGLKKKQQTIKSGMNKEIIIIIL